MSKKKKVDLNGNPLESITIGEIKQHKYGWIGTVLLFTIFILVVIFLPDLSRFYQIYIKPLAENNRNVEVVNNTVETVNNVTTDSIDVYYAFDTTSVNKEKVTVSDIKYAGTTLSFSVKSNDIESVVLDNEDLYFETYDENKTLLNRVILEGTATSTQIKNFMFNVKEGAKYYSVKQILEDDYTYIDIAIDENNTSILTCTKNTEKIVYTFRSDKLTSLEHTNTYAKSQSDYNEVYARYNSLVTKYGSTQGVKASLSMNSTGLNFKMNVDYYLNNPDIEYANYFAKDDSPRKVNFKMEARQFECR